MPEGAAEPRASPCPGEVRVKVEVLTDAHAASRKAASAIASAARSAVAARGQCVMALSGGRTPEAMLHALAEEPVPWTSVHVLQVDERIAPAGGKDRNLTLLAECLLNRVSIPASQVHAMPVESQDPAAAADDYARTIVRLAGSPPVLDLAHLGLGGDGHTASLVPGDPVLSIHDRSVGVTGPYEGRRRMTLTYPVLNLARTILWLVTGVEKASMLKRLVEHDQTIPAGRIASDRALAFVDREAADKYA